MNETALVVVVVAVGLSAAVSLWLISTRRTLRLELLEIVDGDGRVRGKVSTSVGNICLSLNDAEGRTRLEVFVTKDNQPGIALYDHKDNARIRLEIVRRPEELELDRKQLKTMSAEQIASLYDENQPQRPMLVFCDRDGDWRSAMSTDQLVMWGEDSAQIVTLSSLSERRVPCGNLGLANQKATGVIRVGVTPLGRTYLEAQDEEEGVHTWPTSSRR